jgi:hydrogenase large subunit
MTDLGGLMIPRGAILNRDLSQIHEVHLHDHEEIEEFVAHSYYDYSTGKNSGLHPYDGETTLNYTGPKPPFKQLDVSQSYSWVKSPRWKGNVVEVGPLARVLMLYASGHPQTKELVDSTLKKLDVPVTALYSTLGRTAARALESKVIGDAMQGWYDQLITNIRAGDLKTHNDKLWDPASWPKSARGAGFMEAPRGWPRSLDRDRKSEDLQLPGRGTEHVEFRAARRQRAARSVRGRARRHADARSKTAAGDLAHDPQLRSVPGVRRARR